MLTFSKSPDTSLMAPDGEFVDLFTSGVDSKQVVERITKSVESWKPEESV